MYDPPSIAEQFNGLFSSNFVESASGTHVFSDIFQVTETLNDFVFTPLTVFNIINNLPNSAVFHPDGLCYLHLKKDGIFLASKLADLFNLSMSNSRIPSSWRKIVITPVYKSGPRENFANYRPVSVRPTSVVCRVMERITCIVSVIFDFIDRNNIINPSLHDFLPCRSVETASLAFYNFPLKNLGLRHNVEVLLLDFAKAFEKVHMIPCYKSCLLVASVTHF